MIRERRRPDAEHRASVSRFNLSMDGLLRSIANASRMNGLMCSSEIYRQESAGIGYNALSGG